MCLFLMLVSSWSAKSRDCHTLSLPFSVCCPFVCSVINHHGLANLTFVEKVGFEAKCVTSFGDLPSAAAAAPAPASAAE